MIDYVIGGEYLNVQSNRGSTPYINTSNPITGMVSFDSSSQTLKVYDGNSWMTLGGGSATVNLTPNAISVLKWAERKMHEEYELQTLAASNPTIKDLVNQIKEKEDQINMVKTLLQSSGNESLSKISIVP